ncbi:MAG: Na+/H+ antiporter, partial [uncultured Solirubrobacteraceae bacterium]
GGGTAHLHRRGPAGRRHPGVPDRGARPRPRPRALPGHGDARRLGWPRADHLRRLRARADDRGHRARAHPLRGRADHRHARDPARPGHRDLPLAGRHARHRGGRRPHGVRAVRPLDARGAPARRDRRLDGRRGDLRPPAHLDAAAAPRPHARGGGGPQRPGRRPARARLHGVAAAPGLRRRGHAAALRRGDGDRPDRRRRGRMAGRPGLPARAAGHRRPLSRGHAGGGGARLRRRRRAARLGLPRGVPRGPRARHGADPRQADRHELPPGARLGRAALDVPRARPARLPEPAARGGAGGSDPHGRPRPDRPARGNLALDARAGLLDRRADRPLVGGAARRGARGARHLPGDRRRPGGARVLQHRLLRGPDLHAAAGDDVRAARAAARHDHERAGAADAAGGGRDDPTPRRGDPRVPRRPGGRGRGRAGPRPRPPARRGGQRHRPRRTGDPAPRLDPPAGRRLRPPPPALGDGAPGAAAARPLAPRPDRRPAAPAADRQRPPPDLRRAPVERGAGRRSRAARHGGGDPGRRAAADPTRQVGVPVGARRRPLRDLRPAPRPRRPRGPHALGPRQARHGRHRGR